MVQRVYNLVENDDMGGRQALWKALKIYEVKPIVRTMVTRQLLANITCDSDSNLYKMINLWDTRIANSALSDEEFITTFRHQSSHSLHSLRHHARLMSHISDTLQSGRQDTGR